VSDIQSTATWLGKLRDGDPQAAQELWQRYYEQLLRVARRRLSGVPRRVSDEEDVVLSAIDSFCRAAAHGRFPDLSDNHDVWRLLMGITARKICDYHRRSCREKRGGGKVRGESALMPAGDVDEGGIEQVIGSEPSPDLVVEWMDTLRHLLGNLTDPALQKIAVLKLQGYSNREISDQLNCGLRSVERKLGGIRAIWSQTE
jgi:DNA-directed RNA polymerase specialized sigma24 family protein